MSRRITNRIMIFFLLFSLGTGICCASGEITFGTLLTDLVKACEQPDAEAFDRIDADVEALDSPVAQSITKNWIKVYLDPEFTLLIDGRDDPKKLEIPDPGAHAFVVLGYELKDGEMTDELKGRCAAAATAAKTFPGSILVCSGGATGKNNPDQHTEAGLMKQYLVNECGIAAERISIDERAMSTAENAVNTYEILQAQDIKTMTIVTSKYHQRRGQVLYNAVAALSQEESGYAAEIVGNYCFDIDSAEFERIDTKVAARQLAGILNLSEEEIQPLDAMLRESMPDLPQPGAKGT